MFKNLILRYGIGKKIITREECHQQILKTAELISSVAGITLGPKGRNVAIQNNPHAPRITKDGITVVKHIEFENRLQDSIASLIKKSVDGTNKYAGDGTTTSTLLITQIYKKTMKKYSIGSSKQSLRQGLNIAKDIALDYIDSVSRKVETVKLDDLMKVAMISTNRNHKIATLVSEAVSKAQLISIEKSAKVQSTVQYYSGMKFTRGITNQLLKNKGSNKLIYNYPLVVVSELPINTISQVVKALQLAKKARKQLLIFAQSISDSVMSTLIYNNQKKIVEVCGISVPAYGSKASEYLRQISKRTGAHCYDRYSDHKIQNIDYELIGKAVKVEIDQLQTYLIGQYTHQQTNAIIYVGGHTHQVLLQAYDKMVDALNSVKTAKKEGVVAGGGLTFWRLSQLLSEYDGDHKDGVQTLAQALKEPRKQLFKHFSPEKAFVGDGWKVYDIEGDQEIDMFEAGIVDSATVAKSTIIDSVSLASMLIDIEVSIARTDLNLDDGVDLSSKYKI